jgi:hypothetical protein
MPQRFLKFFPPGSMMERLTDGIAILAVITGVNPSIYFWLSEISTLAALIMPILGCMWLGVQIYSRVAKGK